LKSHPASAGEAARRPTTPTLPREILDSTF